MANIDAYPGAKRALMYWYRASGIDEHDQSFQDVVDHYDSISPSFLKNFNGSINDWSRGESRLKSAMEALANAGPGQLPWQGSFFNALNSEINTFRFEDVKDVAKGTLSDIQSVASTGFSTLMLGLGIGIVGYLVWKMRRKL